VARVSKSRLPPGLALPRAAQALAWTHRYPEFTRWAHRRYGSTFTVRVAGLPELERWSPGDAVTVLPVSQRLTLEVILQAVLGVSDTGMRDRLRKLFDGMVAVPGAELAIYSPRSQRRTWWNAMATMYWRRRDELDRLLDEQISVTRADPGLAEREDILALLAQAQDETGARLTDGSRALPARALPGARARLLVPRLRRRRAPLYRRGAGAAGDEGGAERDRLAVRPAAR
jgi:hypothetical protein